MRFAAGLVFLMACGGSTATKPAASATEAPERGGPIKVGERMDPIGGPIAIPVKGAKLTIVNYFATWCMSSQRWMPHVEEMRKKHAADGLAVIGVANYDQGTQADLEKFAKESGATFPVTIDPDQRIIRALPPSGWGQAIIVVDAKGVVRLVHRGSHEGDFEKVAAEIDALLAK